MEGAVWLSLSHCSCEARGFLTLSAGQTHFAGGSLDVATWGRDRGTLRVLGTAGVCWILRF